MLLICQTSKPVVIYIGQTGIALKPGDTYEVNEGPIKVCSAYNSITVNLPLFISDDIVLSDKLPKVCNPGILYIGMDNKAYHNGKDVKILDRKTSPFVYFFVGLIYAFVIFIIVLSFRYYYKNKNSSQKG